MKISVADFDVVIVSFCCRAFAFDQKISCYLQKLMFSKAEGSVLVILSVREGGGGAGRVDHVWMFRDPVVKLTCGQVVE